MEIEVITRADLQAFRRELLNELLNIISSGGKEPVKKWLRNEEACELLNISSSTLKRMRIKGSLKSTKVGGIHYYAYRDIENMLSGKV